MATGTQARYSIRPFAKAGARSLSHDAGEKSSVSTSAKQHRGNWVPVVGTCVARARGHTVTKLRDGRVLVTGGLGVGGFLNEVDLYTPARKAWQLAAPLPEPRVNHSACLLSDGQVLVVGGSRGRVAERCPALVYDPVRDAWRQAAAPQRAFSDTRTPVICAPLPGGRAVVAGGSDSRGVPRDDVEIWDGDRFTPGPTCPHPLHSPWLATRDDGTVVVASAAGVYLLLPDGTLRALGRPRSTRVAAAYALLPDGNVLVAGGEGANGLRSVEMCDVDSGRWSSLDAMDCARANADGVTLGNGLVLVLGGGTGRTITRSALAWDPRENRWFPSGVTMSWRHEARLVALGGARALVVGGVDPQTRTIPAFCEQWEDDGDTTCGFTPRSTSRARPVDQGARDRLVLQRLHKDWDEANRELFGGRLKPVVMELADLQRRIAEWNADRRCIRFSRSSCQELLWPQLREVLRHEMAHQFVAEVLGVVDEEPHGAAFRDVCTRFGIDARASGAPATKLAPEEEAVRRRVEKLRALSRSPNPHESESAQALADKLVADYRELFVDGPQDETDGAMCVRHVGVHTTRRNLFDHAVGRFLSNHGGVQVIWTDSFDVQTGASGLVLELLGPAAHVERAAYMHDFLRRAVEQLWEADQASGGRATQRQRLSFMVAAVEAFEQKIKKVEQEAEHGLVPLPRARVEAFVRARYPRLVTSRSRASVDEDAAARGAEAGRRLDYREGVGNGAGGPRLLGPGAR
ncbi:MAG: SprT-like domain-containing protein [Myxococcota bacterium]